ncbi:peptidylprolyl isomerase [Sporosalibacterium faouarense]|uniref:peptidylprolyl isomerase n=1 Tax=Sporosalibacterium faouarense TaxID=516123 RepID=UPI00192B7929|nr:peptidylprolyl isomerase [Sporosalibacterium faouarense]
MSENKVLATVNGKEITEQDVNALLQSLGPQRAMQFQSEQGKKQLLNELINQELFYLDAKESGMDQEEAYKNELENARINLLKQYAIRKTLNDATIAEQEVKNYYEANREKFKSPESVKASHILVDEEAKAKEITEEINNGLEFGEAAKKYSNCPSKEKGGDLGEFSKGKMVPEFEEAAFNMDTNTISEPVKTQFGYHIIKVTDKQPESIREYEEVKDQLTNQMISMKQNELYQNKSQELKNKYEVSINE